MDDLRLLEQKLPEVRFTSAKQLIKALRPGAAAMVTGPAGSTATLLDEVAAQLGAARTRVLRVRPPYPLSYFLNQVTPSTPDGDEDLLENAFRALTSLDASCSRIALLVEDAHMLPEATLRYIESSLRLGAHLCVALMGEPKLLDALARDSLAPLRKRLTLHLVMPGQAAPVTDGPAAPETATAPPAVASQPVASQPGAPRRADAAPDSDGPAPAPRRRSRVPKYAALVAITCAGAGALLAMGPVAPALTGTGSAWTFTWPPRPWVEDKAAAEDKPAEEGLAASTDAAPASAPVPASVPVITPPQPDTAYAAALTEAVGGPVMSDPATAVPAVPPVVAAEPGPPRQAEAAPAPAAIAAPKATETRVVEPELVDLPGGTFRMGSNKDKAAERPTRSVAVAPFLMAKQPVTVREWQQCLDAKVCTAPAKGRPDEPMRNVSWADARQFAAWLSQATGQAYRLPTEAEWEYAARAGTETRYHWGNAMAPGRSGCKGCGEPAALQAPSRADAYPPNPFGLYAMGGGVAEWVDDCWHGTYQGGPRDAAAWDAPNCRERVLRGGSWVDDADAVRVSSRSHHEASARYPTNGFRLTRSK